MCLAQGPQRSDAREARTRRPSVSSQALYHWATALPLYHFWILMLPWCLPPSFCSIRQIWYGRECDGNDWIIIAIVTHQVSLMPHKNCSAHGSGYVEKLTIDKWNMNDEQHKIYAAWFLTAMLYRAQTYKLTRQLMCYWCTALVH